MRSKILVTLAALVLSAAPLSAELKYTMHIEARTSASGPPSNPMFAMVGDMLLKAVAPGGSVDCNILVGDKGVRMEQNKETMLLPGGSYQLTKPGGDVIVVSPKDKTYWVYSSSQLDSAAFLAQLNPTVSVSRPGDSAEIVGLRADHLSFEIVMTLPLGDTPMNLSMKGDMWLAPQYKAYASMAMRANPATRLFPALTKFSADGLPVRQLLRGDVFGGYELELAVTKIGEEPAPASAFEVPAGFKEIPAPPIRIGGGTR